MFYRLTNATGKKQTHSSAELMQHGLVAGNSVKAGHLGWEVLRTQRRLIFPLSLFPLLTLQGLCPAVCWGVRPKCVPQLGEHYVRSCMC